VRTLVIGIPLPHVSFDNYSFLSAPSFGDYRRLVVDPVAVSAAVQEAILGEKDHATFAGQPIVNGNSSPSSFGLADLVKMRRRETEWLLAQGGTVVCFGSPAVEVEGIEGIPAWGWHAWLPSPPGFAWARGVLPGFGRPGAVLAREGHAFAPYVEEFGPRLAYRAVLDEAQPGFAECGAVLVRSHGGVAIGGEVRVGEGSVIIVPPPVRPEAERSRLADTLYRCLERLSSRAVDAVEAMHDTL
jgi:hypothetical protein